jgi:hypothetical protein
MRSHGASIVSYAHSQPCQCNPMNAHSMIINDATLAVNMHSVIGRRVGRSKKRCRLCCWLTCYHIMSELVFGVDGMVHMGDYCVNILDGHS